MTEQLIAPSYRFRMSRMRRLPAAIMACLALAGAPALAQQAAAAPAGRADFGALRGVLILDDPAQLLADGASNVSGVDFAAGTPRDAALAAAIQPYLQQALGEALIDQLRGGLAAHFERSGQRFVRVSIPAQAVAGGVLQVLVTRGRAGRIGVEGAQWFAAEDYRAALRLQPGQEVDHAALDADVEWINRNPYRRATLEAAPGAAHGEVDLTLRVRDALPLRVSGGINNTGTAATGENRVYAGINWGNAFGLGHLLNYQYTTEPHDGLVKSHAISYQAPMPWRHTLALNASKLNSRSELPAPLDQSSHAEQLTLRYDIPLALAGLSQAIVGIGFDYKKSDSNLLFSSTPVFNSLSQIGQYWLNLQASMQDRLGATSLDANAVYSAGGMFAHNHDSDFAAQRHGAKARYAYLRIAVQRSTPLPAGWSWTADLTAQLASGNLLGSEQLSFSGSGAVRGFRESGLFGDQGALLRNELLLPAMSPGSGIGWNDRLQLLLFWDYGRALVREPLEGERARHALSSIGPGLRYALGNYLSVNLDYGRQLVRDGAGGQRRGWLHFSLNGGW